MVTTGNGFEYDLFYPPEVHHHVIRLAKIMGHQCCGFVDGHLRYGIVLTTLDMTSSEKSISWCQAPDPGAQGL